MGGGLAAALALMALVGTEPALAAGGAAAHADTGRRPGLLISPARMSSSGNYLASRIAQNAGDWETAADHLTAALAADPSEPGLLRRAFLLRLGEGDMAEAVDLADRLAAVGGESFLSAALLTVEALRTGDTAAALSRLDSLPSDGMGRYVTPLVSAWTHRVAGDSAAALLALAPLEEIKGFRPLGRMQAALIHDLDGQADAAEALYRQAMQEAGSLRLVQLLGNLLERQGRVADARTLYQEAAGPHAESPVLGTALAGLEDGAAPAPLVASAADGLAEGLFDLASALHQEGAQDMALLYARISLHLTPDRPLARLLVGDVLMARQRPGDALRVFAGVDADDPAGWNARLRQADALRRLDRTEEAVALLTAMGAERPERTDALLRLADIHRMDRNFVAAIDVYDAVEERLAEEGRQSWVLHYARGMALDAAERWPEAEADLLTADALHPDHPQILNYLGYSWVDRGVNLEEATRMIARAVELRPDDGYIIDSLGWARFKTGDYQGAIDQLERAVELLPLDPTINDHLGDAYWAVGRRLEARFQWQRAAQHAKSDPELRRSAEAKLRDGLVLPKTAATGR